MRLETSPPSLTLIGLGSGHTLLVEGRTASGRQVDLTSSASFRTLNPEIATISPWGFVRGLRDGTTSIMVAAGGLTTAVTVEVKEFDRPRQYSFENDIIPLLSKFGCNSSGCHGKAEGQNGFKLSVFGFDPAADYTALLKESRGRRIFAAAPERSLLLAKVSGRTAHGGGLRIPHGSHEYEVLRRWIAAGAPFVQANDSRVSGIRIEPGERLLALRSRQQLRVIARYTDGREVDVTPHARYQSNNDGLASVNATGLVSIADVPGDAAIMASYMNCVAVFRAMMPRTEPSAPGAPLAEHNFIDRIVSEKLRKLNLAPSAPADDAEFLRRVYLDIIGTLPRADEARQFLGDRGTDRRARLVESLLRRPEFSDYWAMKLADLLRVDRGALGHRRAHTYYRWIHESLRANKPLDQFVREIITAAGPLSEVAPASFYKVVSRPGDMASTLSQTFLGVRIACAECHHHPFDRWGQADYFGMQAFFTPLGFRSGSTGEMLVAADAAPVRHPRTGEPITAHALGEPVVAMSGDPRERLAVWLTSRENPWFARNLANRVWAHFMGRGLVEPVDDFRDTNPPTNPELLSALGRFLGENGFDLQKFIKLITGSQTYQLSAAPNSTNELDEQNYSRALFKRVDAEVLLDMVCQVTGVGEKFPGVAGGGRAIQLWDSKVPHYFLKVFGRPERISACECERIHEPSVSQVLHLLNSPAIQAKLAHEGGCLARLERREKTDARLVEELYLTFYSRFPNALESERGVDHLRKNAAKRRHAVEDLAWSLLNTVEFLFNH